MNNKPVQISESPHTSCNQCPVRKMSLFQGVPKERLGQAQQFRQYQFTVPPKTPLYEEGSKPEYVYTLFDGWMAMYQTSNSGKRQILRFALPGDFLGFQADANGVISHSVSAITKSIVCAFPWERLKALFDQEPKLALRLATMESRDMNLCQHHQTFGSRKDAHQSIAFLLLELFHRTRIQKNSSYDAKNNSIHFPLTQEDMGDAVGITNVHVNRVLRQFVKEKLIICNHRKLTILDEEKLSAIGEFNTDIFTGKPLI